MENSYDSSTFGSSGDAVAMSVFYMFLGVVMIISYVIYAIFLSMIFKKAGVEGWKAWVPIYNQWVFLELGGQKGWLSLLSLLGVIPFLGLIPALVAYVYSAIAAYKIGLDFGKEGVFVLLYIFLPIVWVIWIAVDKTAIWKGAGSQGVAQSAATPPSTPAAM